MSGKAAVLEAVDTLPDEATIEEIIEALSVLAAIRRGETDADAGRVVPHDEVKRKLSEWAAK